MARITMRTFVAAVLLGAAATASADVLLVDRVKQENVIDLPKRGMSMNQVEGKFGAPVSKLDPRGGDSTVHPVINRWEYTNFIVYFERDKVIDSVLKRATPMELGPKSH